jgi:hypothetical protein
MGIQTQRQRKKERQREVVREYYGRVVGERERSLRSHFVSATLRLTIFLRIDQKPVRGV